MSERQVYAIDKHVTDRIEAAAICSAVLDVLRPHVGSAEFDVYSDYGNEMPAPVRDAEQRLEEAARQRPRTPPDPRMGLVLAPDQAPWSDFETYASWSIDVGLYDKTGEWLADFHDSGYSISVALTDGEAHELRRRVERHATLELLSVIHLRRREESRARRRRTIRRWLRLS
ncbi:hypothetical protein [Cellulomonas endophytica]|uniref:hypothetical protein n=1 Tax=Cellulomonas endophytica TaxID=2494735 RepID=UPI00101091DB|nr:hypothetical protein [Cellulomonas endophytica]